MLPAAAQLLREGGADAITVAGVVAKAETSTGAFCARFGNRHGLFEAIHERFLTVFGAEISGVAEQSANATALRAAVTVFVGSMFHQVCTHRDTFAFHVLLNAHDPAMRTQGNAATQALTAVLAGIIARHHQPNDPVQIAEAADYAAHLLVGLNLELLLFDSDDITDRPITEERWASEAIETIVAILAQRLAPQ